MKAFLFLALSAALAPAAPVSLTDNKGRTITATIQAITAEAVQVERDGKTFTIKLADLDAASQKLVARTKPEPPAPGESRVRLRAQTVSSSRSADQKWKTSWGSYDKDVYRSKSVSATVEVTQGAEDGKLVIQWIGSIAGRPSQKSIATTESVAISIKPGGGGTATFDAVFVENDAKYAALGVRDRDGMKYVGWIVRVLGKDGKVLAQQASNPVYLTSFPHKEEP